MDIFIEEIVKRKRTGKQLLITIGLTLLSLLIAFIFIAFVVPSFPVLTSLALLVVVGVFYLAYRLSTAQNVEFEYSMVNTEIDVDRIANRRSRKRLTSVKVTGLEARGVCGIEKDEFNRYLSDVSVKKIYAAVEKKSENNYFVVYYDGSVKNMLIFSPSEEMIKNIEKFKTRK